MGQICCGVKKDLILVLVLIHVAVLEITISKQATRFGINNNTISIIYFNYSCVHLPQRPLHSKTLEVVKRWLGCSQSVSEWVRLLAAGRWGAAAAAQRRIAPLWTPFRLTCLWITFSTYSTVTSHWAPLRRNPCNKSFLLRPKASSTRVAELWEEDV